MAKEQLPYPLTLLKKGDKVVAKNVNNTGWRNGVIVGLGTIDTVTINFKPGRNDSYSCHIFARDIWFLPPTRELHQVDPRRRLQKYAKKHGLLIARDMLHSNRLKPVYCLVDPDNDFARADVYLMTEETATLCFSEGSFYSAGDYAAEGGRSVIRLSPGGRELPLPKGLEP